MSTNPLLPGERTRLGCWFRRPAEIPKFPGGTPGTACETPALPGTDEHRSVRV